MAPHQPLLRTTQVSESGLEGFDAGHQFGFRILEHGLDLAAGGIPCRVIRADTGKPGQCFKGNLGMAQANDGLEARQFLLTVMPRAAQRAPGSDQPALFVHAQRGYRYADPLRDFTDLHFA